MDILQTGILLYSVSGTIPEIDTRTIHPSVSAGKYQVLRMLPGHWQVQRSPNSFRNWTILALRTSSVLSKHTALLHLDANHASSTPYRGRCLIRNAEKSR